MNTRTKRIIFFLVVIFVLYAIVNDPVDAADTANYLWDLVLGALQAMARFFDRLLAG